MSIFFVMGFGAVFMALGASATAIGHLLLRYRYEANIVGGIIVIAFGLFMLGLARHVSWFHRDFRFHPRLARGHPVGALVLGVAALRGGLRHRGLRGNGGCPQDAGRDECAPNGDERRVCGKRSV